MGKKIALIMTLMFLISLVPANGFLFDGETKVTGITGGAIVNTLRSATDTVLITDMSLNEPFSTDVPSLTGTQLRSLGEHVIATQDGLSRYRQVLRFSANDFNGGSIQFVKAPDREVGDFLTFDNNQPMFEYEMTFSPALESRIEDGEAEGLQGERINILGKEYFINKADVSGNSVLIEFVGPTVIRFEDDDITDNDFEDGVDVNQRSITDGSVKIRGTASGNTLRIFNIVYRFEPDHKLGGDLFIPPRRGAKQFLREPRGMLHPGFEVIYGGIRGDISEGVASPPARRGVSGTSILFKPSGDDQYRLFFTNVRGQQYRVPLVENDGGTLIIGEEGRALINREGANNADFNIAPDEMFVVTSNDDISGVTNIVEYESVDFSGKRLFFRDLAGGDREISFNPTTGQGVLPIGGSNYDVFVDLASPHHIVVDLDRDGDISSDRAHFNTIGGFQLHMTGGGGSVDFDFIVPKRLFRDGTGSDEEVDFDIVADGNDVRLVLNDQTNLELEKDRDRIEKGLTPFGVFFFYDEDDEPEELTIEPPGSGGQRTASVFVRSGQSQGIIIVTLELDRLLENARKQRGLTSNPGVTSSSTGPSLERKTCGGERCTIPGSCRTFSCGSDPSTGKTILSTSLCPGIRYDPLQHCPV